MMMTDQSDSKGIESLRSLQRGLCLHCPNFPLRLS